VSSRSVERIVSAKEGSAVKQRNSVKGGEEVATKRGSRLDKKSTRSGVVGFGKRLMAKKKPAQKGKGGIPSGRKSKEVSNACQTVNTFVWQRSQGDGETPMRGKNQKNGRVL